MRSLWKLPLHNINSLNYMAMPLVGTTKGYLGLGVGQGSPEKRCPTELSGGLSQRGKIQHTGFGVEAFCFPTETLAVPRSLDVLEVKIQPRFAHHSASEHLGFPYGHYSVLKRLWSFIWDNILLLYCILNVDFMAWGIMSHSHYCLSKNIFLKGPRPYKSRVIALASL